MTEQYSSKSALNFVLKTFELEHSSAKTILMIKVFGDDTMSAAQIKVWCIRFKDGRKPVESDSRSEGPSISRAPENVEHVRAAINKDLRLTK